MINFLVEEKHKGKSYSDIRKILEKQNFDEYKVTEIIREVDALIIESEGNKHNKNRAKSMMLLGFGLVVIQLGADFYRGIDVTDLGDLFLSVASIVVGGGVFIKGYKDYNKFSLKNE